MSIVIITHDRDELLRQSLASAIAQEGEHSQEIIVVDDVGSPTTRAAVRDVAGDRFGAEVRLIDASGAPGGASRSRNVGARAATGRVLAFLDDDDLWHATYVHESLRRLVESGSHFVLTWMEVLERDGVIAPLLRMPEGLTAARCVARNMGMTGSNIVIREDAFAAVGGFDEQLQVSNDKDLLVRLLADGSTYAVVPEFLAVHRRHNGPQLTRMDERRATGLLFYLEKHRALTSMSDRRFIMKTVHGIRRRTASAPRTRLMHHVLYVANQSPAAVLARLARRQRDGAYRSV